ncbi:MAG: hypothetical protein A2202_06715 [Bdellovibrionales bacterium RIFOXYA1_FULL_36_14]|nr:MAG: hypothetical protein A2202_06715 [Bdellovibrionales bacterium RIFOXYA1_FULL_36_14]
MKGKLILVPTPIDENSPLEPVAKDLIIHACNLKNSIFAVEELKSGRRRWIHFGLPRESVADLILFNEHTNKDLTFAFLEELNRSKDIYLMSDGGLPAFMDPGMELVRACHENDIEVTATPFCNSIALALALSGINHKRFLFEGSLPVKIEDRERKMKELMNFKGTVVLLDTPYRLKKTLEDLANLNRNIFLAMDLNCSTQELIFGTVAHVMGKIQNFKREFILIIE